MLTLHQLTKKYQEISVVNEISLRVEEAESLIIIGTSGSGKTTTLKMINRLVRPDSGFITLYDERVDTYAETDLRRQIGYVFQDIGLFPHWTIYQNLAIVPRLLKWPNDRVSSAVSEWMHRLKLPTSLLKRKPHELSGGQQQRIGLGRALIADPALVLMDEPFGALDPVTREEVRADFLLVESLISKTIVMVTHDIEEAFLMGDRIAIMNNGRVEQVGEPLELLLHPASAFVTEFIAPRRSQLVWDQLKLKDIVTELKESEKSSAPIIRVRMNDTISTIARQLLQRKETGQELLLEMQGRDKLKLYRGNSFLLLVEKLIQPAENA